MKMREDLILELEVWDDEKEYDRMVAEIANLSEPES